MPLLFFIFHLSAANFPASTAGKSAIGEKLNEGKKSFIAFSRKDLALGRKRCRCFASDAARPQSSFLFIFQIFPCGGKHQLDPIFLIDPSRGRVVIDRHDVLVRVKRLYGAHGAFSRDMIG